jgi:AcrR family transcriptional regulator
MQGDSPSPAAPARPGVAERLWQAARREFSERGYHGARVQGIARRAGCNVALLYRHWASKKALYIDVLRTTWQEQLQHAGILLAGGGGAAGVVEAYLDTAIRDVQASQIFIREMLDGGPFFTQILDAEPALTEPVRAAVKLLAESNGSGVLRPGLDPTMVVLTVGGVAALIASVHDVTRVFVGGPSLPVERWREHVKDLLVNGLVGR